MAKDKFISTWAKVTLRLGGSKSSLRSFLEEMKAKVVEKITGKKPAKQTLTDEGLPEYDHKITKSGEPPKPSE